MTPSPLIHPPTPRSPLEYITPLMTELIRGWAAWKAAKHDEQAMALEREKQDLANFDKIISLYGDKAFKDPAFAAALEEKLLKRHGLSLLKDKSGNPVAPPQTELKSLMTDTAAMLERAKQEALRQKDMSWLAALHQLEIPAAQATLAQAKEREAHAGLMEAQADQIRTLTPAELGKVHAESNRLIAETTATMKKLPAEVELLQAHADYYRAAATKVASEAKKGDWFSPSDKVVAWKDDKGNVRYGFTVVNKDDPRQSLLVPFAGVPVDVLKEQRQVLEEETKADPVTSKLFEMAKDRNSPFFEWEPEETSEKEARQIATYLENNKRKVIGVESDRKGKRWRVRYLSPDGRVLTIGARFTAAEEAGAVRHESSPPPSWDAYVDELIGVKK